MVRSAGASRRALGAALSATHAVALRAAAITALPALLDPIRPDAVAFQGAIGRGWGDEHSDVDLVLAFDGDHVPAPRGELRVADLKWSIFHLRLDRVDPKRWGDKQRYAYAHETEILFDPSGRLASLCSGARLSDAERTARLVHGIKKLGNRGITYQGRLEVDWRGFHWSDRPDVWLRRGDPYAAHARLDQAHQLLVALLFALAAQPVPSEKTRHHLVRQLTTNPPATTVLLEELALVRVMDGANVWRRIAAAMSLLTACVDEADRRGVLPHDLGAAYTSMSSGHSDDTFVVKAV